MAGQNRRKDYLLAHYESFNILFVIAFSQSIIYGIKVYSKVINSEFIIKYIVKVIDERK